MKSTREDASAAEAAVISARPAGNQRKRLIKAAVSIGLIAFILSRVDLGRTVDILMGANFGLLAMAWSLTFVGALLTASRWRILLTAQGVDSSLRHMVACWLTACFFNQFLPSTIGGDAVRVYDSWKLGATKAGAAAVIGVDRLLGLFSLMIFGVIALYLSTRLVGQHPEIRVLVVGAALFLGLIGAWIFFPNRTADRIGERMLGILPAKLARMGGKFRQALAVYRGRGAVLAKGLALSAALQLNVILFYFLVAAALSLPVSFMDCMLIIPVASVVLLLPITINGVGLREGVFVLLLSAFGVSSAAAVAFAWASFILFTLYGLLGGLVYALRKDVQRIA